jgi:hypothetical protein
MNEHKSLEPHGLHDGCHKAAAQNQLLSQYNTVTHQIPYSTGFAPTIRQNLMDYKLEKDKGEYYMDKMRTIELMNAEANTNNKKLGRDVMANGKKHGLIPLAQAGSRKHHQAAKLVWCKRFIFYLLLLLCLPVAWCSNDVKSCYDHCVVQHWIATLCLLCFGINWGSILSPFNTLEQAEHLICMAFGDFSETFKLALVLHPYQGVGQGNAAGPAIWVVISALIMAMMHVRRRVRSTLPYCHLGFYDYCLRG